MTSENEMQKKCGFCGESIPVEARRCPYCGSILEVTFDNNYKIGQPEYQQGNSGMMPGSPEKQPDMQGNVQPSGSNYENRQPSDSNYENRQPSDSNYENRQQAGMQNPGEWQSGKDLTGAIPPENDSSRQQGYQQQGSNAYRPYGNNSFRPNYNYTSGPREPLSNGLKVFLTTLFAVVPGIGQLAGIIAAIVFMNSEGDNDRKSFGVALLVASLVMFVISCIGCFVFILAVSQNRINY